MKSWSTSPRVPPAASVWSFWRYSAPGKTSWVKVTPGLAASNLGSILLNISSSTPARAWRRSTICPAAGAAGLAAAAAVGVVPAAAAGLVGSPGLAGAVVARGRGGRGRGSRLRCLGRLGRRRRRRGRGAAAGGDDRPQRRQGADRQQAAPGELS